LFEGRSHLHREVEMQVQIATVKGTGQRGIVLDFDGSWYYIAVQREYPKGKIYLSEGVYSVSEVESVMEGEVVVK
jgi:hypothetical protein